MDNTLDLKANQNDISTYSNFHQICQKHIKIDAYIDFKTLSLIGTVHISFKVISPNDENRIVLDCKNLNISGVRNSQTGKDLKWTIYENNPDKLALGTPLIILLESDMVDTFTISIDFCATETDATQWLAPHQTISKKYPFMFTQCEAILCRSLIPCQDTPSAKITVEANLTVEKPLRALYSGIEVKSYESGENLITYEYIQNIPVPTYLIAIACGELEYGKLSERCGIFTEVGLKEKAVWEFENTEDYLKTAENYLTPYKWGVYNILVLPFAFPYGGMENPCLTFVTPALIAGDRSMTNVIAHEIAHSWTGNLVTNKDWANFWMNEGFTTFMERKICELMYGEEMSNLEAKVGQHELKAAIDTIGVGHNYTSLAPDFSNVDPDDGFSVVPYEKGYTFIYYLETLVGKENFQSILRKYINCYALKSVSHHDFRKIFEDEVKIIFGSNAENQVLSKIEWDNWITTNGQPIKTFEFKSKWNDEAINLAEQFLNNQFLEEGVSQIFINWHTNVKIVFLEHFKENISRINDEVYNNLKNILGLHKGYNAEIKHLWYQIALKLNKSDVIEYVKNFLSCHGRMKYIRPVYFAWFEYNKQDCLNFFDKNKTIYHSVAARLIEQKFASMDK